jgi:hypothetical protein
LKRPQLALRIGITGAISLDAKRVENLSEQLRKVLGLVKEKMWDLAKELADEEEGAAVYAGAEKGKLDAPKLRLLSPLARGADRLAAEAALELGGYELFVPMPFAKEEYEEDFKCSDETEEPKEPEFSKDPDLDQFRRLLKLAGKVNWLALDGDRAEENRAHESVGGFVVRNCDILIAIWDGDCKGGGRGGTAEIVRYAARNGVPVWWINATKECEPVWIENIQDLRDLCCDRPLPEKKCKEESKELLNSYLEDQIRPPRPRIVVPPKDKFDRRAIAMGRLDAARPRGESLTGSRLFQGNAAPGQTA